MQFLTDKSCGQELIKQGQANKWETKGTNKSLGRVG